MTEPREIEAKFEADTRSLEKLLELESFAGFSISRQESKDQDDLYFDTDQQHLKQHGASLRIRRKESAAQMTFKGDRVASGSDPNLVSRLEDEVTLHGFAAEQLAWTERLHITPEPSPLRRARELSGGVDLLPSARLQTNRTVLLAQGNDDQEIELAVDRCVATRLEDGRIVEFVEVEAELKRGGAAALGAAVDALMQSIPGLTPSSRTKLERALD